MSEPRHQLSEQVASAIREQIISGHLRPEEFVRVERVAEDMGISPTPVREGLLQLRGEGFLRLEPRRGFIVAELSSSDLGDLYWVQAQLAGELAARAVVAMSYDDVAGLLAEQEQLNAALEREDFAQVNVHNHTMHRAINLAGESPKLLWFLRTAALYVPNRFYRAIDGWPDASLHDHVEILEAFRARNPDAARRAMSAHIIEAGKLLVEARITPAEKGEAVSKAD